jgi:hypothetical protein
LYAAKDAGRDTWRLAVTDIDLDAVDLSSPGPTV